MHNLCTEFDLYYVETTLVDGTNFHLGTLGFLSMMGGSSPTLLFFMQITVIVFHRVFKNHVFIKSTG